MIWLANMICSHYYHNNNNKNSKDGIDIDQRMIFCLMVYQYLKDPKIEETK
jgi:hypothetical protein